VGFFLLKIPATKEWSGWVQMHNEHSLVDLTVVIPVYNSAAIFPELYRRLVAALEPRISSFEIIAVVDGCKDNSFGVINGFAGKDPRVKALEFSRNFGHQAAVTAGLFHASGAMIAIMDDDLEDPPELLLSMLDTARKGYDVVYGIRRKRKRSLPLRILFSIFYRILGKMVDIPIPRDAGDFCVMSRRVLQVINNMPESNRYLRGLRAWSGFSQTGIEYERDGRFAESSGYTLRKYVALALDGIFSFSYRPLKYVTCMGVLIAALSFAQACRIIFLKLTGRMLVVPGWTSLSVSILFLSGIQLISMGIIGEYVARIFDEVKRRPKYVIKTSVGFGRDDR